MQDWNWTGVDSVESLGREHRRIELPQWRRRICYLVTFSSSRDSWWKRTGNRDVGIQYSALSPSPFTVLPQPQPDLRLSLRGPPRHRPGRHGPRRRPGLPPPRRGPL